MNEHDEAQSALEPPTASILPGQQPVAIKQRRPHRKTKTGCVDCRRRRVKCDEGKPACASCTRREVVCEYSARERRDAGAEQSSSSTEPHFTSLGLPRVSSSSRRTKRLGSQTPSPFGSSSGGPGSWVSSDVLCAPEISSVSGFSMGDMALFHHWVLSTSLSICREPTSSHIWQHVFPEIGFKYPFVTHAILSLAALHCAHDNGGSDDSIVAGAVEHHTQSLYGFHQSVANITEENSEALFVWSLLNMIYVLSRPTRNVVAEGPTKPGTSNKDLILGVEWIPMIRGIEAVLMPTHNYLRFGRMQQIMSVGNWLDLEPGSTEFDRFDHHLCATRETWNDHKEAEMYDGVLRILRKCRMFILQFETMDATTLSGWSYNRSWSGPLMFIHYAPHAYFTHLYQRQPPALVLFAYFGALLHGINEYWFIEGWGQSVVAVIDDLLGSYWRPWITWPLELVGLL